MILDLLLKFLCRAQEYKMNVATVFRTVHTKQRFVKRPRLAFEDHVTA